MSSKKTILVTGALGHIGSELIRKFDPTAVGNIIMIDNFEAQRYCSLFDLPTDFSYTFVEGDIRTFDLAPLVKQADVVIHLAAITNAEASVQRVEEVEQVNLEGLKRIADSCLQFKKKLLFPSTTSVYGSAASRVDEAAELKPQSPYAESKLAAEQYLQTLGQQGLDFVICRFGTIFGWSIGMRFHTAVNKFIFQAVTGQPLTVWKTAWEQRRPYLDLADCVAAVNFILKKEIFNRQIYNVLTSNFTVKDIVGAIEKLVPSLKVNYVDSEIMNQLSYDVDDGKFRQHGFTPNGNLDRGVEQTIQHFDQIKP